jgi:galactose mutarotase-like enzyme
MDPTVLTDPTGALEATFLPHLGMVCSSLTHHGDELLAPRGGPDAYAQRGSTFGIPLLHPWANRLSAWSYPGPNGEVTLDPDSPVVHVDGDTGLPSHGLLAASRLWRVTRSETDERHAHLEAELDFSEDPRLLAAFPFPHRLTYYVAVGGDQMEVELTVTPTASEPVPISFGFHPYFTLPGTDRRNWALELPVRRQAMLDGGLPTGATELIVQHALDGSLATRAFDDCFDELDGGAARPPVFALADARRHIAVEFTEGYDVAQVYAPAGSDFICFEPMTAPVDALRSGQGLRFAQPGGAFTATFIVTVS